MTVKNNIPAEWLRSPEADYSAALAEISRGFAAAFGDEFDLASEQLRMRRWFNGETLARDGERVVDHIRMQTLLRAFYVLNNTIRTQPTVPHARHIVQYLNERLVSPEAHAQLSAGIIPGSSVTGYTILQSVVEQVTDTTLFVPTQVGDVYATGSEADMAPLPIVAATASKGLPEKMVKSEFIRRTVYRVLAAWFSTFGVTVPDVSDMESARDANPLWPFIEAVQMLMSMPMMGTNELLQATAATYRSLGWTGGPWNIAEKKSPLLLEHGQPGCAVPVELTRMVTVGMLLTWAGDRPYPMAVDWDPQALNTSASLAEDTAQALNDLMEDTSDPEAFLLAVTTSPGGGSSIMQALEELPTAYATCMRVGALHDPCNHKVAFRRTPLAQAATDYVVEQHDPTYPGRLPLVQHTSLQVTEGHSIARYFEFAVNNSLGVHPELKRLLVAKIPGKNGDFTLASFLNGILAMLSPGLRMKAVMHQQELDHVKLVYRNPEINCPEADEDVQ